MRWWPTLLGLLAGYAAIRLGLSMDGDAGQRWLLATRWTARIGFPFLFIAFTASSLARLWPNALTGKLLRDRRWWGLGFAMTHTAHLCALTNHATASGEPLPAVAAYGGGAIYALMYAMALTSFPAAQRAMGAWWRRLHKTGIYVLGVIFMLSYVGKAVGGVELPASVPMALLAVGAFALRFMAWRKARA